MAEGEKQKKQGVHLGKICGQAALTILVALLLIFVLTTAGKMMLVRFSDTLMRYQFTGLENMFHRRYEYYVSVKGRPVKVPKWMVALRYPDYSDERSKYDDDGISYYYVRLIYNEEGKPAFENQKKVELSHGKEYVLIYDNWTNASREAGEWERGVFREITELLYDFGQSPDLENCRWYTGGGQHRGLLGFMMITDGRKILLYDEYTRTVYTCEEGTLHKVMDPPKGGGLDYCMFAGEE